MSDSTLEASISEAERHQYMVTDSQLVVIWEDQCEITRITDSYFGITPFLVDLSTDEIAWLDFACEVKPEFRSGASIDWEVLRRISGKDPQEWMGIQKRLERKGIISRKGLNCQLVWAVMTGRWVHNSHREAIKSQSKSSKRKGKKPANSLRLQVTEAHPTCIYCGQSRNRLTMDHIVPRSQGGSDYFTNLGSACQQCNQAKADRTPEQWALDILQYRRRMRQKPVRFIDSVLHHRHTLGRLGHRIGYAITAVVTSVLAILMLRGGHR